MPHEHAHDLDLGHRLADTAAAVSLAYFRREYRRWSKTDGSLVTEADLSVEDAVRSHLGRERPSDAMVGEERGLTGSGPRRWIVDGIDGTVDFASGQPDWGTLIALEIDGELKVAICDQPAHQRRYWATRGGGAFVRTSAATSPLRVSGHRDLPTARSYVPPAQWLRDERSRAMARRLAAATTPTPHVNHPAIQVATGEYELAVFLSGGPWDLAAPALIVHEAGGTFTNLEGRHDLTTGTAIFSNGLVHDQVRRAVVAGGNDADVR